MSRRLVLIGGGHAHVEVVRRLGLSPPPDTAVELVSPDPMAYYSGMLPGVLSGRYSLEEASIDLPALCTASGVAFREAAAVSLKADERAVTLSTGEQLPWDVLSLNTGSAPDRSRIPGATEHGRSARPVNGLVATMEQWLRPSSDPLRLIVVGGGAGGCELAIGIAARFKLEGRRAEISLLHAGERLVEERPHRVHDFLMQRLAELGVEVRCGCTVTSASAGHVITGDGAELSADEVIWSIGARGPEWLGDSGLSLDAGGFVAVSETLESLSHSGVFAAGDTASLPGEGVAKAGVYAVREGPVLAENLKRALSGETRRDFEPQDKFLALLSEGNGRAIGSRGGWVMEGPWLWWLKDRIDRSFMERYQIS